MTDYWSESKGGSNPVNNRKILEHATGEGNLWTLYRHTPSQTSPAAVTKWQHFAVTAQLYRCIIYPLNHFLIDLRLRHLVQWGSRCESLPLRTSFWDKTNCPKINSITYSTIRLASYFYALYICDAGGHSRVTWQSSINCNRVRIMRKSMSLALHFKSTRNVFHDVLYNNVQCTLHVHTYSYMFIRSIIYFTYTVDL